MNNIKYAAVVNNKVIAVTDSYKEYPPTENGQKISTLECPLDTEIGMIYNSETNQFLYEESVVNTNKIYLSKDEKLELFIMEMKAAAEYNACLLEAASI